MKDSQLGTGEQKVRAPISHWIGRQLSTWVGCPAPNLACQFNSPTEAIRIRFLHVDPIVDGTQFIHNGFWTWVRPPLREPCISGRWFITWILGRNLGLHDFGIVISLHEFGLTWITFLKPGLTLLLQFGAGRRLPVELWLFDRHWHIPSNTEFEFHSPANWQERTLEYMILALEDSIETTIQWEAKT